MKNNRIGLLLGIGVLCAGTALTVDSASARPGDRDDRRDNREARKDVKEARKDVKEARKDLRKADDARERREAQRDLEEARRELRDERQDLRNEHRDNNRPGWNNNYRPPVNYGRPPVNSGRPPYGNAYGYYGRPGNRYGQIYGRTNSWNNGWRTVEGIVTSVDRGDRDFYIRLRDGRSLRVLALNGVPSRLYRGDFVRMMGTYPSQTLRAERIDILTNR